MSDRSKDTAMLRLASRIERVRGEAGIEAWLVEDRSRPMLSLAFAFRGGVLQDRPAKAGSVAMMSDLLLEGAEDLPGEAYQIALSDRAIELQISHHRDHIRGSMRLLQSEIARAFDLLAMALLRPEFSAAAFARHRETMRANLSMSRTHCGNAAHDAFIQRALPYHPYGHTTQHKLSALDGLSLNDVRAAYAAAITRGNLVLAVVGAIAADKVVVHIDEAFGGLPTGTAAQPVDVAIEGLGESIVAKMSSAQTAIVFGRPALPATDRDFASALVIAQALGGGFNARLMTELREKRGLCYGIGAGLEILTGCASLIGSTTVANEKAQEAGAVIRQEFRRLVDSGLTEYEIESSKGYLAGSMHMKLNSSKAIAAMMIDMQLRGRDPQWLQRRISDIASVTRGSIAHTLPRLLADGALLFAMAGSPAD